MLKKEREAMDGVADVRRWLGDVSLGMGSNGGSRDKDNDCTASWRVGGWSRAEVAMELGGVLKAEG